MAEIGSQAMDKSTGDETQKMKDDIKGKRRKG
jgi:hypothetical protein